MLRVSVVGSPNEFTRFVRLVDVGTTSRMGAAMGDQQHVHRAEGESFGLPSPAMADEETTTVLGEPDEDKALAVWLDQIRDAERRAERETSGIRLR